MKTQFLPLALVPLFLSACTLNPKSSNSYPLTGQGVTAEVALTAPIETALSVPGVRETQAVWVEMIQSAQKNIDLEHFYINHQKGEALQPVIDALKEAAKRGVKIRFLLDSKFFKTYPDVPRELSKIENFRVKTIDYSSHGGIQHAKFMIIDQRDIFIGSANFDWLALSHIHEVGVRVNEANAAQQLESVFSLDWSEGADVKAVDSAVALNEPLNTIQMTQAKNVRPVISAKSVQLVVSPDSTRPAVVGDTLTALVKLLDSAKKSIKVQMYQYTTQDPFSQTRRTWSDLDQAMRKAAARGVQVQFLVDSVAMKDAAKDLKALAAVPNIEVRTVLIPEWSGGHLDYARLIHSKYVVVDQEASWVGTENWSEGYFFNSRNVGLILNDASLSSTLNIIYDQLWWSAYTKKVD